MTTIYKKPNKINNLLIQTKKLPEEKKKIAKEYIRKTP